MWDLNNPAVLNWNKSIWGFLSQNLIECHPKSIISNTSGAFIVHILYIYSEILLLQIFCLFCCEFVETQLVCAFEDCVNEWFIPKAQTHGSVMCVSVDGLLLFSSSLFKHGCVYFVQCSLNASWLRLRASQGHSKIKLTSGYSLCSRCIALSASLSPVDCNCSRVV